MKILVVDDHPLILHALTQVLPDLDADLEMLGATNRDETLTMLARHPDCALVLLDLALPGAHGLDLLAELRRDFPRLPIVVLSATHDRATIGGALAAGARGFIAKTADRGRAARRGPHRARRRRARHARHRADPRVDDRRRADRRARASRSGRAR